MVFKLSDRVKETTTTTGISNVSLGGAYAGYRTFASAVGNGNATYYVIVNGSNWEVGLGTYHTLGNLLSRDTVIESTNSGGKISLTGVSDVFVSQPAEKVVCMNPDGLVSGVGFTGYAFPDGSTQSSAGIEISGGAGLANSITFWADSTSLSRDPGLQFSSNTLINNHPTKLHVLSGIPLTMVRDSSGNLFQAYVDNGNDRTITLHLSDESSPTWKFGLRDEPGSEAAPEYGYIYGTNGSVGQYASSDTSQILNYSNGFWVTHKSANLLNINKTTGTAVYNSTATATAFTVKGAAAQVSKLQEWKNVSDQVVAYVDPTGSVSGNSFRVSDITFSDGTANYTAAFPFVSGYNLTNDLVTVSGLVATGGEVYDVASGIVVNNNIDTVSGSATALTIASGTSILTTVSLNTSNITANDYDILATSGSLRADLTAASGFHLDNLIASGTAIRTLANTNNSNITQNTNDIAYVSGIAVNPTEYYDVASGIIAINNLAGASGALRADITTNASDISTNTTSITTNAANIVTSSGSATALVVSSGTSIRSDVSTNAGNISTNTSNITTNAADIVTASGALRVTATANGIKSSANETNIVATSGGLRADLTTETNNAIGASGALRADLITVSGVAQDATEYFNIASGLSLRNELLGASGGLEASKANLASPTFTGTPAAPTASAATNTTQIATTAFVRTEVINLIDSSPAALDTLNELAAALGDDAAFSTTVTNSLATKATDADLVTASGALRSDISVNASDIVTASGSLNAQIVSTNTTVSANTSNIALVYSSGNATSGIAFGAYAWGNHASAGYLTTETFALASGTAERAATIASGTAIRAEINTYTAGSGLELHGSTAFAVGISGDNILATNSPTDNYIPSFDASTRKFTWVENTGGGGEANEHSFKTISVAGQTDVVADTTTDTLTLVGGTNVTITTTAASDTITIASADTNTQLTQEQVEDFVGGMLGGTETLITVTYQDSTGDIDFVVDNNLANYDNSSSGFITATLTEEQVEDFVGGMLGGTETGITVTYQDSTHDIDFVVADTTVAGDSGSTGITPGDTLTIAGGTNVTTVMSGDTLTITATDTNTQLSTEAVQDIVGGMVDGNTETGIAVTYEDSDGTLDFVISTLNQDTTGNAATATALETARTINGVSFDGTGNIVVTAAGSTLSDTVTIAKGGTGATSASAARTALGVDAAGADNSTNVTLVTSSHDYLSISTQAITLGAIDLAADVTGTLPVSSVSTITLGTNTAGNYVATVTGGTGITATGATSGEGIAHSLSVDASQTQITAVGTIVTGTWQGTTIAVNQGGTGATSLDNLIGIAELSGIARGKIIVGDASGDPALLTAGTEDYVLTMDSNGDAVWAAAAGGGAGDITAVVAGTLLDGGATSGSATLNVDLTEAAEATIANGDYILFLDGGATGTHAKEAVHDLATLFAGAGLTATNSVIAVDTLNQNTTGTAATVTTAAQPNITSVGTLTSVVVADGGNIGSASDTDAISIASTGAVTFSKATKPALKDNSDGATITFNVNEANVHKVTLGDNRTLAILNETAGQKFMLRLQQDATGSRTVTWFSTIKWAGGSAPTLTTTASKADVFGFLVTGTDAYDGFVIGQNI